MLIRDGSQNGDGFQSCYSKPALPVKNAKPKGIMLKAYFLL